MRLTRRPVPSALLLTLLLPAAGAATLPATQYTDESADLGSFFVEIAVGQPPQRIRAQVDTGSGYVVVPAGRADCASCSSRAGRAYERSQSSSARAVPCHSNECLHGTDEMLETSQGALTLCLVQIADNKICPPPSAEVTAEGVFRGEMAAPGAGQCLMDPAITPGPAEACIDHLEISTNQGDPVHGPAACTLALAAGFTCSTPMATFDPSLSESLSHVCPETCGLCGDDDGNGNHATRFCDDNAGWQDDDGDGCAAYRDGGGKHAACFSGHAGVACPIACGTCGDCCATPPPGAAADTTPECYFYMRYGDGSIVSGSKVKDYVDLNTNALVAVEESAVGVFSHVGTSWEPSTGVDGVLGLSAGLTCNPSCEHSYLDHLWEANPWLPKIFALCLSGGAPPNDGSITGGADDGGAGRGGSIDIGETVTDHYSGEVGITWFPMGHHEQIMGDHGYTIAAPLLE